MKNLISPNLAEVVKDFLKNSTVVVVDQNSSARVGLKKILISMGTSVQKLYLSSSFQEAESLIKEKKPRLVFCDFQVDGRYGLELLQQQREEFSKETKDSLFVLVTANTSQSAIAQAAEEDIDAYILKPYTVDGFVHTVSHAILTKVKPSKYLQLIEQGKNHLERSEFDRALKVFQEAIQNDRKPALACYYEGLTHFRENVLQSSQGSYEQGLQFSKIHYKCLVGLFDILMFLKKYELAYEVVQRIVFIFPANPKRLATVLRLAIQTKNYDDVRSFYEEFIKIEARSNELVKTVCAAMLVCGWYFLDQNERTVGLDLIHKATVTAAGRPSILRKAIEILSKNGAKKEAQATLKRFAKPSDTDIDYAVAALLVLSLEDSALAETINRGQQLIHKGMRDLTIYQVMIAALQKYGLNQRAIELLEDGAKFFPELKNEQKKVA